MMRRRPLVVGIVATTAAFLLLGPFGCRANPPVRRPRAPTNVEGRHRAPVSPAEFFPAGADRSQVILRLRPSNKKAIRDLEEKLHVVPLFPAQKNVMGDQLKMLAAAMERSLLVMTPKGRPLTPKEIGEIQRAGGEDGVEFIYPLQAPPRTYSSLQRESRAKSREGAEALWHAQASGSAFVVPLVDQALSGGSNEGTRHTTRSALRRAPIIAVIDSGVRPDRVEGESKWIGKCRVYDGLGLLKDPSPERKWALSLLEPYGNALVDGAGHGTDSARLACEASGGHARIISYKVLGATPGGGATVSGTTEALAAAIYLATAPDRESATFINMSLGYLPSNEHPLEPHVAQALAWAYLRGARVIAAAGNSCKPSDDQACESFYPAAAPWSLSAEAVLAGGASTHGSLSELEDYTLGVISVGGHNWNGEYSQLAARGCVDIAAPSEQILLAPRVRGQATRVSARSCRKGTGTSLATPQVTGSVALLEAARRGGKTSKAKSLDDVLAAVVAPYSGGPYPGVPCGSPKNIPWFDSVADAGPGPMDLCAAADRCGLTSDNFDLQACEVQRQSKMDPAKDCSSSASSAKFRGGAALLRGVRETGNRSPDNRRPSHKNLRSAWCALDRPTGQQFQPVSGGGSVEKTSHSSTDSFVLDVEGVPPYYKGYEMQLTCDNGQPLIFVLPALDSCSPPGLPDGRANITYTITIPTSQSCEVVSGQLVGRTCTPEPTGGPLTILSTLAVTDN